MKRISIRVSQENIEKGKRYNPYLCPLSIAIREQYPQYNEVLVQREVKCDGVHTFTCPQHTLDFINAFDRKQSVQPATLILNHV